MSKKEISLRAFRTEDGNALIEVRFGSDLLTQGNCDLRCDADRDKLANEIFRAVPALELERIRAELRALDPDALPSMPTGWEPDLVCMKDIEPRPVSWLWRNRIASGRISLLVGMPGCGKSFVSCDMAARVSTGRDWPDGSPCERGSVLFITAEDDPADTIRPRLDAHHADVVRVHLLAGAKRIDPNGKPSEVMFTLAELSILERAMERIDHCRLIVVDPIGSFLGAGTDSHRDNEVRGVLAPLSKLAERYGAAVLVVAHRRKSVSGVADDTALGSRAFTGLARSVWHLSKDGDDPKRRLLLPGKCNLSAEPDGLAFAIVGDPASIEWEPNPVAMSADDALSKERSAAESGQRSAHDEAVDWLAEKLSEGTQHAKELKRLAKEDGIAVRTLERAKSTLGIVHSREGFNGPWVWSMPVLAKEPCTRQEEFIGEYVQRWREGDASESSERITGVIE
jgi:hypothetical protein